jgi:hypothetical protein
MKKTLAAGAVLGAMLLGAVPAGAEPNGKGLDSFPATCDGQPTTITTGGGASFYVEGQKYHLTSLTGSFIPADGSEPQFFTKEYGNRTGKTGPTITCTGGGTDETGTFDFTATGVTAE